MTIKERSRKFLQMSNLKDITIYLAGPIDCAVDLGVGWRQEFKQRSTGLDVDFLDPTQKPKGLLSETKKEFDMCEAMRSDNKWQELADFVKKIIRVDLKLVDKSDVLVAYIDKNIYMCGTMHEIVVANQQKKPIMLIVNGGKPRCPGWLFGLVEPDNIFDSIESCINKLHIIDKCDKKKLDDKWVLAKREYDYADASERM